jgi:hypothetical protein
METRAFLLSPTAETYAIRQPVASAPQAGFWAGVKEFFKPAPARHTCVGEQIHPEEGQRRAQGYLPFCRVDDISLWIQETNTEKKLALFRAEVPLDLADWGTGSELKCRLISEFYFLVTKDDFKIDDEEARVMMALINFLQPTPDEITYSRQLVYWSLVNVVCEDNIITSEERATTQAIAAALDIPPSEYKTLHQKIILEKIEEVANTEGSASQANQDMLKVLKMAEVFEIRTPDIEQKAEQALQKVLARSR